MPPAAPAPVQALSTATEARSDGSAPQALVQLSQLAEEAAGLASEARAKETRRVYTLQWRSFASWARARGFEVLPATPAAVAMYVTEKQRKSSVATVAQILASISFAHRTAGLESPTKDAMVKTIWEGICRTKGVAPKKQAAPLSPEQLRELSAVCSARDRSLLLLGFAAARRRSEIVNLELGDVVEDPDGLRVTVRKSKTDQLGVGYVIGVPYGSDKLTCPVRALRDWLVERGDVPGKLFLSTRGRPLSGEDVSRIIRRAAKRAGFKEEVIDSLSGHSLRAGLATTAAKRGKSATAIAKQGGWKSMDMVLRYVRDAELFENNPASGIGL